MKRWESDGTVFWGKAERRGEKNAKAGVGCWGLEV